MKKSIQRPEKESLRKKEEKQQRLHEQEEQQKKTSKLGYLIAKEEEAASPQAPWNENPQKADKRLFTRIALFYESARR